MWNFPSVKLREYTARLGGSVCGAIATIDSTSGPFELLIYDDMSTAKVPVPGGLELRLTCVHKKAYPSFCIQHEGIIEHLEIELHLLKDYKTGSAEFDRKFWIRVEDEGWAAPYFSRDDIQKAMRAVFSNSAVRIHTRHDFFCVQWVPYTSADFPSAAVVLETAEQAYRLATASLNVAR